jgi:hypothetical protein
MKKEIVILGSGAQGKITADLCRDMGLSLHGYLDDTKDPGTKVNALVVLGGFSFRHRRKSMREFCSVHIAMSR